ncbi:hypothetical protein VTJ83DRAFT_1428 [Remersonia thermophila]|uniref:Thioredoxin domain-containing protein n=1 Tax=Remersonia thermophila TaxID=72144 RepID=A0ABR4DR66_9PEZI
MGGSGESVQHITSPSDFDSLLSSTRYVVADFYADWCGPCRMIAPFYSQMASNLSIPGFLAFAKVNVDSVGALAARYGVSAMPTFMFFKDGKQVAVNGNRIIQGADKVSLEQAVAKMARLAREKADAAANETA